MASALSTVMQFPSPAHGADESHHYLVFFIPGNPGPVAYYGTFLSYLHSALNSGSSSNAKVRFEVFGRSLSAEDDDSIAGDNRPNLASAMAGEIELMERALLDRVAALTAENKRRPPPKVIMIGHCSGAYIALELIKKLHAKRPGAKGNRFDLAGTVCLFPSVSMKTVAGTISQAVVSGFFTFHPDHWNGLRLATISDDPLIRSVAEPLCPGEGGTIFPERSCPVRRSRGRNPPRSERSGPSSLTRHLLAFNSVEFSAACARFGQVSPLPGSIRSHRGTASHDHWYFWKYRQGHQRDDRE